MPLNLHLNRVKMEDFMFCVFYHNKQSNTSNNKILPGHPAPSSAWAGLATSCGAILPASVWSQPCRGTVSCCSDLDLICGSEHPGGLKVTPVNKIRHRKDMFMRNPHNPNYVFFCN